MKQSFELNENIELPIYTVGSSNVTTIVPRNNKTIVTRIIASVEFNFLLFLD
jgi:hypothetical protein